MLSIIYDKIKINLKKKCNNGYIILYDITKYIFYSIFIKSCAVVYNNTIYIHPMIFYPIFLNRIFYYFNIKLIYKHDSIYKYSIYNNNIINPILNFQIEYFNETYSILTEHRNDIKYYNNTIPLEFIIIKLYNKYCLDRTSLTVDVIVDFFTKTGKMRNIKQIYINNIKKYNILNICYIHKIKLNKFISLYNIVN